MTANDANRCASCRLGTGRHAGLLILPNATKLQTCLLLATLSRVASEPNSAAALTP
jgi:hypothetical protein